MLRRKRITEIAAVILAVGLCIGAEADEAEAVNYDSATEDFLTEDEALRYEGEGYASPEEAVSAYLEAFRDKDIKRMLSTFAIETLMDHFQFDTYIERMSMFNPLFYYLPGDSEYTKAVNIESRRAHLAIYIGYAYGSLYAPDYDWSKTEALKGRTAQEFVDDYFRDEDFMDKIELTGEFIDPVQASPHYAGESIQRSIAIQSKEYEPDEIQDRIAVLKIDGVEYIQCMSTIRYGDKWYNLNLSGYIGNVLGLYATRGGLAPREMIQ